MQNCLIRYILSPLATVTDRLSQKTKDRLFVLAGLGVLLYFFLYNMYAIRSRYLISYTVNCGFLGIMILCSLSKDMKPVKFRWSMMACWFGVGVLMLLSGIRNSIDYLPEAMLILVVYPIFYICWNNQDRTRMFRLLIDICRWSAVIFFVASFFISEITSKKYSGFFVNVNNGANYLSLVCACMIADLVFAEKIDRLRILDMVLVGASVAIIYYTGSRSGMVSVLCALLLGGMMYLTTHRKAENGKFLLKIACCAAAAVIGVTSLVYLFQLRQYVPLPYYDNITRQFYFDERWTDLFASKDDESTGNQTQAQPSKEELEASSEFFGISGYNDVTSQKTEVSGKTLDAISTGRFSIWKAYIAKLNLWGHAEKEPIYLEDYQKEIKTTHMTILEIAYESGIFTGILYFLLNIGTGITAIWFAWKYRNEKYAILPLMVIVTFGVDSVLRTTNVSFNYMTTFYYYLILFPIVVSGLQSRTANNGGEHQA